MRRTLITLVLAAAVMVAAPSVVLAAHHGHHHARHHRAHRTHHRRHHVRHRQFGKADPTWSGGSPSQAGTVTSFSNGILTITLNDGSTVSGAVTSDTQVNCMAPDAQDNQGDDNGDNNSGDDNGDNSSNSGDDNGDNSSNSGDDNGGGDDDAQMCSTADLTPGTPVADANLELTGNGAVWNEVDLITSSSSTSSNGD